jgi:NADPH2:quinone reductase
VRAAVCPEHGTPDVVRIEDVPSPSAGPGQVRVRVGVAAVNFPDVLLVAGTYQIPVATPFVPGSELAGVIDEVGEGVDGLAVGDRVMGTGLVGAFAEEAVLGADAVRRIPDGVDLRVAAAFGVAHRTAYHVLRSVARVQPGEELVVLGAGGGVGLAAVQLGRELGASVTAVASSAEKLAVAAAHGATHLVDHSTVELRGALRTCLPEGADVVVDPVGGALAEPALRHLRWGGRFVTVGYASGEIPRIPLNLVLLKGIQVLGFQFIDFARYAAEEFARNEGELVELLASGRAAPHVGAALPLEEAAAALQLVAGGRAVGKVVLEVADVEGTVGDGPVRDV